MLLQALLFGASLVSAVPYAANQTHESCNYLYRHYQNAVTFPGSLVYAFEDTFSWSTDSWMGPSCIFTPSLPEEVTLAIQLLGAREVPFAIRGGGMMPVSNAANIGPEGVLFSTSNMTSLTISDDKSTVTVGAGVRFKQLYDFVAPHGVVVNGVRIGDIGVVGYHLGGGLGFFSYEHGMSPGTVRSIDCVLGNGTQVTASNTSNPDLFWALRGGGNNFCFVTSITLETLPYSEVYLGNVDYGINAHDAYMESMTQFALNAQTDPSASVEGQVRWNPSRNPNITYHAFLFSNSDNPSPPGLVNLTAPVLPTTAGNITRQTMSDWFKLFPSGFDYDNRKRFIWLAVPASAKAYAIAQDTYYRVIMEGGLGNVRNFFTAFSVMPISKNVITNSPADNALGLTADNAPALWFVASPSWEDGEADLLVDGVHAKAFAEIDANLRAAGITPEPFIYLSDAAKGQPVFESYGKANWDRLKSVAAQYDPNGVFQTLVTGGAKVSASRGQSS